MAGWVAVAGQHIGFPGKPLGKGRVTPNACRQDLQGRNPIPFPLAPYRPLPYRPYQDLQKLKLREMRRQFQGSGCRRHGGGPAPVRPVSKSRFSAPRQRGHTPLARPGAPAGRTLDTDRFRSSPSG